MINCSSAEDYHRLVSDLESELAKRGYLRCLMQRKPYDPDRRLAYLRKFHERSFSKQSKPKRQIIVLKVPYSPQLRHLGIKSSYNRLQQMLNLQCELISAHPTRSSLMLETYKLNYTVEDGMTV